MENHRATRFVVSIIYLVVIGSLGLACDRESSVQGADVEHSPVLTQELVPTQLQGLLVGSATEADVVALFPTANLRRDASFGESEDELTVNGMPAIAIHVTDEAGDLDEAIFVLASDGEAPPTLMQFTLEQNGDTLTLCSWSRRTLSSLEGVDHLPGSNRRFEVSDEYQEYAIGVPDGSRGILVECSAEENRHILTYTLVYPGGLSMDGDFSF